MTTPNPSSARTSWAEVATPEQMLKSLEDLRDAGVLEYVLPTIPLGERWVVGIAGDILKFSQEQAACFVAGAGAVIESLSVRGWGPR